MNDSDIAETVSRVQADIEAVRMRKREVARPRFLHPRQLHSREYGRSTAQPHHRKQKADLPGGQEMRHTKLSRRYLSSRT